MQVNEINQKLNKFGYCILSNHQITTPKDLLEFTKKICNVCSIAKEYPDVIRVAKDGFLDKKDIPWHSDGGYLNEVFYSFLLNVENMEKVPTLFLDTHLIVQDFLDLKEVKNAKFKFKFKDVKYDLDKPRSENFGWFYNNSFESHFKENKISVIKDKSIYRVHPISKLPCLFLSANYIKSTSSKNINILLEKISTKHEDLNKYIVNINIQKKDLIIYDNFRMLHSRPSLHNTTFNREMWRTTGYL